MNKISKFFISIIIYLSIFNYVLASNPGAIKTSLSGKIYDKTTGESLPGVTIYIPGLKTGAVSDTSGYYRIDNLPMAKLLVQVTYLGYQSIVMTVDLKTTKTENFLLDPSITEMKEVVITGSSEATEIKRNPVPIITMQRKELQQILATNIIDAIAKLPGLNAVTTGPNVSKPFIHGLGYNRVLTLYDGVRQEGQQWGDEHGIEVDENAIDKIEVVKGPASLIYGSDAIAGVINLLPSPPVPIGALKGNLLANYQSNNGLCEGSFSLNGNNNGFIWGGRISHKQATDYQNNHDGRVYGTALDETDADGYVGLNKQWGYSHLNFSVFDDLQEIPDGSRNSANQNFTKQISEIDTFRPIVSNAELNSYKISTLHQHVQHYRIYSSNNFIIGQSKLGLILGYQESIRREFSHPQYPDIPGLYLLLHTFTYDIKYNLPEIQGLETTVGVNGMYQSNTNNGTEFIIPDYKQFDIGPFLFLRKTYDKLDVSAGVRYDNRFFKNNEMFVASNPKDSFDMQVSLPDTAGAKQQFYNFRKIFSGLSGSIGATYNFTNELLVKVNIARGFRAPNIAEISANGVHPGTNIYQIGNTGFKPEFSLQEDIGIDYATKHITGSIEIFNNVISNYIFNQKLLNYLGSDSVIVRGNETFKFQQSRAQLYGGEASLDIHPHPLDWLHFENSVSIIYAINLGGNGVHITDSNRYLPFIPPLHTNSELRANIKRKFKYFSSVYIKIGMEHYAKQNRVYSENNTETITPGYTLFDAGIGTDVTDSHGKVLCSINILGNNITNLAYQSHLSRLKYMDFYINKAGSQVNVTGPGSGIYNMGRNISIKVIVPLDL